MHYTHQHVIYFTVIHSCKMALFTSQLAHHSCMYDAAVNISMCLNNYHILKQVLVMTFLSAQTCDSWWTHHSKLFQSLPRQWWNIYTYIYIFFFKYNQQDAVLYNILYYCQRSTCFRRFLRPSSGAQKPHSIGYMSSLLGATASGSSKQAWHIPDAVCTVFELLMMGGETAWNT